METTVLSKSELFDWLLSLPLSPSVGMLLGGDRISCCDEGVAIKIEEHIVGIATIAPRGEQMSGQPTIVALYILPAFRRKGYGRILMEAAIYRCLERGFAKVRVDVMSSYAMRIINFLPPHLQSALDVHDQGDMMDAFV